MTKAKYRYAIVKTDGDVDIKDIKRAVADYMHKHEIPFEYCHVMESNKRTMDRQWKEILANIKKIKK